MEVIPRLSTASKGTDAEKNLGKDKALARGLLGGHKEGKSHGVVDGPWADFGCSMPSPSMALVFLDSPRDDLGWGHLKQVLGHCLPSLSLPPAPCHHPAPFPGGIWGWWPCHHPKRR